MNIIFDFDGTLNDTSATYVPAFRLAYAHLVEIGYASPRSFSREEIMRWVGYSIKDMWDAFAPDLESAPASSAARWTGLPPRGMRACSRASRRPSTPFVSTGIRCTS